MASPADLEAQLAKLRSIRSNGIQTVTIEGRSTTFRTDKELSAAIDDLERRLENSRKGRITTVRLSSSKGF